MIEESGSDTLVDRLRGKYKIGPDGEFGTRNFGDFVAPISLEAATRIEELEEKLKESRNDIIELCAEACDALDDYIHNSAPLIVENHSTSVRGLKVV